MKQIASDSRNSGVIEVARNVVISRILDTWAMRYLNEPPFNTLLKAAFYTDWTCRGIVPLL